MSPVTAGSNVTYRIEVTNNGPDDAQTVTLSDTAPANPTFVSDAQDSGPTFNCSQSGGTITCTISTLPVNSLAVFSFTFNVTSGTADDTEIVNVATISSTTADPRTSDNTSETSITVASAANACTLTCPSDRSATAGTGQCAATVTYSAPTTSGPCGSDPPVCSPPSGSAFPIGTTVVTCSVAAGGTCSFNVVVSGGDATPPTISCPANISTVEDPAGSGSAHVAYTTPSATDNCTTPDNIVVACSPPSGSSFPTGRSEERRVGKE